MQVLRSRTAQGMPRSTRSTGQCQGDGTSSLLCRGRSKPGLRRPRPASAPAYPRRLVVRWGFLGAGVLATNVMGAAVHAAAGAELYAVGARDIDRATALRPTGSAFSSYEQVLADPDVDAVYIALANDTHCPWTIAALDAGKHVLCEKPLGLDSGEVAAMAAAAERADRLLVEALFYRWHPQIQTAVALLSAGRVGTVRHVDAGFSFTGVAPGNYRLDPTKGGGALYDLGCYPVSAALWAFGRAPVEVQTSVVRGDSGVDISADLDVTFDGGEAALHVSMGEPDRQWLTITGDDGVLEVADRPFTAWFGPDGEIRVGADVVRVPATDPYRVMVEQVSAAVEGERAFVVPLDESRMIAAVIDAAFASASGGGPAPVADA